MISYILQVILFQVLFLAVYDFFLSTETFFTKNRWYLLSTPILSFLLPLVRIPTFTKVVPQEYIVYLPEIILSPEKVIQETSLYQSINYIAALYSIGVLIFSVLFFVKLFQIISLINAYKLAKKDGSTLVLIPKQTKAFSFFNYIFIGEDISDTSKEHIIAHELVHSKQKHSLDLLVFEFLKIVMWFNPMIFIYQKRITLVHEYISDEVATKNGTKDTYINQLLSSFFQVEDIAFINQFYKRTLIKKRIIMMKKKQSKKMNQLKYLVLIPVLMSMLFYTSCSENNSEEFLVEKELQTRYRFKDGIFKGEKGKQETYLDSFYGIRKPTKGEEISLNNLSTEERGEYELLLSKFKEKTKDNIRLSKNVSFHLYKMPNGRKMHAMLIDFKSLYKNAEKNNGITEELSFLAVDIAPTFPGCDLGDKDCFSKMIQKHFGRKFNADLPNTLGLKPGRKRIFIGFKINKEGDVVDVKAKTPHKDITAEVLSVMSSLPKMYPGKKNNEKVSVQFAIPVNIIVE